MSPTAGLAAWLANQLVASANVHNPTAQENISFAIWDIMDGNGPQSGGISSEIDSAFRHVLWGYSGANVGVFTPAPLDASQEFLVVNGPPVSVPEPGVVTLFAAGLIGLLVSTWRLRGLLRARATR